MTGLTYDSGFLIAASKDDRRVWAIHQRALMRGERPVVPASVLAEVYRGHHAGLDRMLGGCKIEALTDVLARATGMLLAECNVDTGVVDATVIEGALRRGDAVMTSNLKHLKALADATERKIDLVPV